MDTVVRHMIQHVSKLQQVFLITFLAAVEDYAKCHKESFSHKRVVLGRLECFEVALNQLSAWGLGGGKVAMHHYTYI